MSDHAITPLDTHSRADREKLVRELRNPQPPRLIARLKRLDARLLKPAAVSPKPRRLANPLPDLAPGTPANS